MGDEDGVAEGAVVVPREEAEREAASAVAELAARKHQQWLSTPKSQGGGNVMVSRYSWKHPFPGAVRSKKSGGYYDPGQWSY